MTIQPGAVLNTAGFGNRGENVEVPVYMTRAPTSSDNKYPVGKRWVDINNKITYELNGYTTTGAVLTAVWGESSTSTGALDTINSLTPTLGNINIVGTANQITVANASSTVTLSIPSPFIGPGSISATTTLSAGDGFSAEGIISMALASPEAITIGNVLAEMFVLSPVSFTLTSGSDDVVSIDATTTTGTGLVIATAAATQTALGISVGGIVVPVTSGSTGSTPRTVNARFGTATFSSVSIAPNAFSSFVINNTLITSSTQTMLITHIGGNTGSALSIQSVILNGGAHTATIAITNGTGAEVANSDLTINFWLLN